MIEFEYTDVYGWGHAIRGMRNPLNSWDKSDSVFEVGLGSNSVILGENDLGLMHRLHKAGTDHRKFMRMITVYVDITAPQYWWSEYDTYKVGTVANSCSKMHTIHKTDLTLDDFSHEHLEAGMEETLKEIIGYMNCARQSFVESKEKDSWWQIIQLLPMSFNQKRTVMLNYEVLANMYHSRKNHKLDEWREFCKWIETLPYSELIVGENDI